MRNRFDPRRSLLLIPLLALFGCESTVTEPGPSSPPKTPVDSLSASERQGSLAGCTISPTGTNYSGSQGLLVTLASPVGNSEVHYTTDGTEPNKQSALYSEAFLLSSTLIDTIQVKARAWSGSDSSPVVSHKFVIGTHLKGSILAPRFSIEPGPDRYRKVAHLKDAEATKTNRTCQFNLEGGGNSAWYYDLSDFPGDSIVIYSPLADTVLLHARCWAGASDISEALDRSVLTSQTIAFQPLDLETPEPALGELVDARDGHTYKSSTIGTQTWMAENLAFKIEGMDSTSCKGSSEDSCVVYGRSYTWNQAVAADSVEPGASASFKKGVCPDGWHVPSQTEWATLLSYVTTGFIGVGDFASVGLGATSLAGYVYGLNYKERFSIDPFVFNTKVIFEDGWEVGDDYKRPVKVPRTYWWTSTSRPYGNAIPVINMVLNSDDWRMVDRATSKYLRCLKDSP